MTAMLAAPAVKLFLAAGAARAAIALIDNMKWNSSAFGSLYPANLVKK